MRRKVRTVFDIDRERDAKRIRIRKAVNFSFVALSVILLALCGLLRENSIASGAIIAVLGAIVCAYGGVLYRIKDWRFSDELPIKGNVNSEVATVAAATILTLVGIAFIAFGIARMIF